MRSHSQETIESSRPKENVLTTIEHCLRRLYADTKTDLNQLVVQGLTYEELIGALLLARDALKKK